MKLNSSGFIIIMHQENWAPLPLRHRIDIGYNTSTMEFSNTSSRTHFTTLLTEYLTTPSNTKFNFNLTLNLTFQCYY